MSVPFGIHSGWWITCPAGTVTTVDRAAVLTSTTSIRLSAVTKASLMPSGDQVGSYSSWAPSTTARIWVVPVS